MPKELFPFRYRDPLTRKWVRARYVAERPVIAERYKEWEITGPPEIREDAQYRHFSPFGAPRALAANLDQNPTLNAAERWLVLLFLRRYVTYCARRCRFAQMREAALLHRDVTLSG